MNNKGFTLSEALLSLFVISIIIYLNINLLLSVSNVNKNIYTSSIYNSAIYINKECVIKKDIIFNYNKLNIYKYNDDVISYYIVDNILYRDVNNKGYVVIYNSEREIEILNIDHNFYLSEGKYNVKLC